MSMVYCQQCAKEIHDVPETLSEGRVWCSNDCSTAWYAVRPAEAAKWTPIEEFLPGGRYDGMLEENGFDLRFPER